MFAKLMLIALVGVVSAEQALTTTVVEAGAQAYCGAGTNTNIPGGGGGTDTGSDDHVVTIQHGKCRLELKAEHTNRNTQTASPGSHFDLVTTSVSVPDSGDHSEHQGFFNIQWEDNKLSSSTCNLDVQTNVSYRPNIDPDTNEFTIDVDMTYIPPVSGSTDFYETGYQFQQWYDNGAFTGVAPDQVWVSQWDLLQGTETNYGANSNSWKYFISGAEMAANVAGLTSTAVRFDWDTSIQACNGAVTSPPPAPTGCDAACVPGVLTPSTTCPTDVTCQHAVDDTLNAAGVPINPDGVIMATHTYTTHDKHRCWVDHAVANFATDNTACKCMCIA